MMKKAGILITAATVLLLTGCRTEADLMAKFCLQFDEIVKSSDSCETMSNNLNQMLNEPQPGLKNQNICSETTACLPCRSAVQNMLSQCGSDESLKPVLERMHFSKSLRVKP